MNVLEELEETIYNSLKDVIATLSTFTAAVDEEYAFLNNVEKDIEDYKKEGVLICNFQNETCPSTRSSSVKENEPSSKRLTRRNVLDKGIALSNVSNLVENPVEKVVADVPIKIERTSKSIANGVTVKPEVDMLPPKNTRVPKNRPVQVKLEREDNSVVEPKDSLSVVIVEDTSEIRVTRSRTKRRAKADGNVDVDVSKVKSERTRTKSRKKKPNSGPTDEKDKNHDSLSEEQNLNCKTNVVETTQAVEHVQQNTENDITGVVAETKCVRSSNASVSGTAACNENVDDSGSPQRASGPRKTQFFTPSAKTPVAKCGTKSNIPKMGTPSTVCSKTNLSTKGHRVHSDATQIPQRQNSSLRNSKLKSLQNSTTTASGTRARTGSALKASQIEFREREMRRKQKEEEALRKKQALILAQTEGRRIRREEREMKVHQMKMDLEKEKHRQLMEAEKAREEKFKQVLAEKEARFFKQKEEAARKRAAAAQKVEQEDTSIPAFLTCSAPLLPTPDCYDSDDSSARGTFVIPEFQKKENIKKKLFQMQILNSFGNVLFPRSMETPNLLKIFPAIKASQLKRTSSAIWNRTERSIIDSFLEE